MHGVSLFIKTNLFNSSVAVCFFGDIDNSSLKFKKLEFLTKSAGWYTCLVIVAEMTAENIMGHGT